MVLAPIPLVYSWAPGCVWHVKGDKSKWSKRNLMFLNILICVIFRHFVQCRTWYSFVPHRRYAISISGGLVSLTWNSDGKLLWFDGKQPPPQLVVAAVCRTNQSHGAFAIGGLVVKRHLLIGQDVIVVWGDGVGGVNQTCLTYIPNYFKLFGLTRELFVEVGIKRSINDYPIRLSFTV